MFSAKINNKCKSVRAGFRNKLAEKFNLQSGWIAEHVATCPRCQKRLGNLGRVDMAMNLLKSQQHSIDLLMKANAQAINVLKHSLRESEQAETLKIAKPGLSIFERSRRVVQPVFNAAACLMVVILFKAGIFNSIENSQTAGKTVAKNYCAMQLGNEAADDIFS